MAGKPLCGGTVKIVIWCITGDLEFLSNELKYPSFNSNQPCWMCPVSRVEGNDCMLTDLRQEATWKNQLFGDVGLVTKGHPVETITGFGRFHAVGDLMHTGCLGVCAWTAGAVLTELVFDGPFRGNVADRVNELFEEIQEVYQVRGSTNRLSRLTLAMFYHGVSQWACFTGKAAESRSLVYVLHDICQAYNTGSRRGQHRLFVLQALCSIYDCCFKHDLFIPINEALEMRQMCDRLLVHYNWLCKHAVAEDRLCYNITVKHHMLWHICDMSRFLNPKVVWAYEFEDFVGTVITPAKANMHGTPLRLVGTKVQQNWLLVLQLRLCRQ